MPLRGTLGPSLLFSHKLSNSAVQTTRDWDLQVSHGLASHSHSVRYSSKTHAQHSDKLLVPE